MAYVNRKWNNASGRLVEKRYLVDDDDCLDCRGKGFQPFSGTVESKAILGIFGNRVKQSVTFRKDCPSCFGTGKEHREVSRNPCGECKGKKHVFEWRYIRPNRQIEEKVTCSRCNGLGYTETVAPKRYVGKYKGLDINIADQNPENPIATRWEWIKCETELAH